MTNWIITFTNGDWHRITSEEHKQYVMECYKRGPFRNHVTIKHEDK